MYDPFHFNLPFRPFVLKIKLVETSTLLIILLAVNSVAMLVLAFFYLRRRQLCWHEYILWGILALILPVLGPFLVIATRPGELRKGFKSE